MKKADIAIGVIVVAAVLFFVLCIPYARSTGLVTEESHSAGNFDIEINKLEIHKCITVEFPAAGRTYKVEHYQRYREDSLCCAKSEGDTVDVYYNPFFRVLTNWQPRIVHL